MADQIWLWAIHRHWSGRAVHWRIAEPRLENACAQKGLVSGGYGFRGHRSGLLGGDTYSDGTGAECAGKQRQAENPASALLQSKWESDHAVCSAACAANCRSEVTYLGYCA